MRGKPREPNTGLRAGGRHAGAWATRALACLAAAALSGAFATAARAATTWTVNTTVDAPPPGCTQSGGGQCSIRQALAAASAGDTIVIPPSTIHYAVTRGPLVVHTPVTIEGEGEAGTVLDAGGSSSVISIDAPSGTTILAALTLTGGSLASAGPSSGGGGVELEGGSLLLSGASVSGNAVTSGDGGGGVFDDSSGTLTLTDSTVSSNSVSITTGGEGGGGILDLGGPLVLLDSSVIGNSVGLSGGDAGAEGGGGVYEAGSSASITASTIADNTATIVAAEGSDGGGGIYDSGGPSMYLNDTVYANSVTVTTPGAIDGGGALFHDGAAGSISDLTIDQNSTNQAGGGILNEAGAYTLKNTIVADNGSGCAGSGGIISAGFNLEGSDTCELTMASDITNTDPRLGPLANNGGPTLTQALTPASPAIDAGSCTDALGNPVTSDQRGVARPQPAGGKCDIGAFEFVPSSPLPEIAGGSRPLILGSTRATFSGLVNPDGLPGTVRFEYGLDARYLPAGSSGSLYDHSTPPIHIGPGYAPAAVSATVSGLVPAALYHVRLVAANAAGTVVGPDQTFVTAWGAPPPPRPVLAREIDATPQTGLVRVLIGTTFVPLTEARQLSTGTEFDARQGTVQVTTAGSKKGLQTGTFGGAVFTLSQTSAGLTAVSLLDGALPRSPSYRACHRRAATVLQTLRANAIGNFRIAGRYSVGSARDAQWTTSDRCDGTRTVVSRGVVSVNDLVRHVTVTLHGRHSYLARAPR